MLTNDFQVEGCLGRGEKKGDSCRVVCGACRMLLCRIRATHAGVTDDEYEALKGRHKDAMIPMKRSHVRALRKSNVRESRMSDVRESRKSVRESRMSDAMSVIGRR